MGLHDGPIIKVNGKLEDIPVPSTPAPLPPTAETDVEDMGSQFMAEDIIRKHSEPAQAQAQDYSPPPPPPTLGMPGVARKGRTPSPKSKQAALSLPAPTREPMPMFGAGIPRYPNMIPIPLAVPEAIVQPKKDKLDAYKENKQRISFVMESGTFMVSVVDLVATAYSIAVITAAESDACNFVPAIGSKFKLEVGSSCYDCIYPGSRATISELGIDILFLIREK